MFKSNVGLTLILGRDRPDRPTFVQNGHKIDLFKDSDGGLCVSVGAKPWLILSPSILESVFGIHSDDYIASTLERGP